MEVVHAADEARRQVGRDLHDGVQQRLVSLVHLLAILERQLDDPPELLGKIRDEVAAANEELRTLARGLHPVGLSEGGLGPALEILAARSPLPLEVAIVADRRMPEPIEVTVFFMVSEAVSNAVKHARASRVDAEVRLEVHAVVATVADDGRGGANAGSGSGLRGLQERVASLGGTLTLDSPPGGGTTLTAEIPLGPYRTAREPFLEIGDPERLEKILDGRITAAVSVVREWELEGGVPGIGDRLPVIDPADNRRRGCVEVRRMALARLGDIDEAIVDPAALGHRSLGEWRERMQRSFDAHRPVMTELLRDPDWRLTDDEPVVAMWFEVVERL